MPTSDIKAILFDLDGTMLDTWPDILHCLRAIEHKYISPSSNRCENARYQVSIGTEAMLKVTLGAQSVDPHVISEVENMYVNLPKHKQKSQLFTGMEQLIDKLNFKKIPWGIVTNKPEKMIYSLFTAFPKLLPPSMCVICPENVNGKKKPDSSPIQKACAMLQLPPSNCVVVGDSIHDIIAGKNAGAKTIGVLFGYIPREQKPEKEWGADFYIRNVLELNSILDFLVTEFREENAYIDYQSKIPSSLKL